MSFTYEYPRAAITTDSVVFLNESHAAWILLIKRKNPPFKGKWALPGGFLEMDETLPECANRELREETGLSGIELRQFRAFDRPDRDPRHRTISVVFVGFCHNPNIHIKAADDASEVRWFNIDELPPLAFDHDEVIEQARNNYL